MSFFRAGVLPRPERRSDTSPIVEPYCLLRHKDIGWNSVPSRAYLMTGWPLNSNAPTRDRRGQGWCTAAALGNPPGSPSRGRIGGLLLAAVRPRLRRSRTRATPLPQFPDALRGEGPTSLLAMTRG